MRPDPDRVLRELLDRFIAIMRSCVTTSVEYQTVCRDFGWGTGAVMTNKDQDPTPKDDEQEAPGSEREPGTTTMDPKIAAEAEAMAAEREESRARNGITEP